MKDKLIRLMTDLLEEEYKLYGHLLTLSRRKQDILVTGDIKNLDQITKQEEQIIRQVGRIEGERVGATAELAREIGIPEAEMTLARVIPFVSPETRDRLEDYHRRMIATLGEIDKVNEQNSQLIKQSLSYIDFVINLTTEDSQPTYHPGTKNKESGPASRLFDKKV